MTYEGPVHETVPEYEIVCTECGRVSYVRADSPERAEGQFSERGWIIDRGMATCRTCAARMWREDI